MDNANKKRKELLGMSFGTASHRLRKSILFNLLVKYKENICFQCKKPIENIDDLSIEHKVPWLNSGKPIELFFDLDNIAFSHLSCNCREASKDFTQTQEWKENFNKIGLAPLGEKHPLSKVSDKQRLEIRQKLNEGKGPRELGREYNLHFSTIQHIRDNKQEYTTVS